MILSFDSDSNEPIQDAQTGFRLSSVPPGMDINDISLCVWA